MTTIELKGVITAQGTLEVDLPSGVPSGEVTVRIDLPASTTDSIKPTWTPEELRELLSMKPLPREEFLAWLDANPPEEPWGDLAPNEDVGEYIHRLRRQDAVLLDEPEDSQ